MPSNAVGQGLKSAAANHMRAALDSLRLSVCRFDGCVFLPSPPPSPQPLLNPLDFPKRHPAEKTTGQQKCTKPALCCCFSFPLSLPPSVCLSDSLTHFLSISLSLSLILTLTLSLGSGSFSQLKYHILGQKDLQTGF